MPIGYDTVRSAKFEDILRSEAVSESVDKLTTEEELIVEEPNYEVRMAMLDEIWTDH